MGTTYITVMILLLYIINLRADSTSITSRKRAKHGMRKDGKDSYHLIRRETMHIVLLLTATMHQTTTLVC